jgi:hypothetical protein
LGNERAIQALVATAADLKQPALWLLAAQGLEAAAAAGNATAIAGLATLAAAPNQVISKQAVLALEAAARKNQPRADEALRKLGWSGWCAAPRWFPPTGSSATCPWGIAAM